MSNPTLPYAIAATIILYGIGYYAIKALGYGLPRSLSVKETFLSAFFIYPPDIGKRAIQRNYTAWTCGVLLTFLIVTTFVFR